VLLLLLLCSQYDIPVCSSGFLEVDTPEGLKRFGITRAHLEEDAGKNVHSGADSLSCSSHTLVDFNRAGVLRPYVVCSQLVRCFSCLATDVLCCGGWVLMHRRCGCWKQK
jgi:hypothetical protein